MVDKPRKPSDDVANTQHNDDADGEGPADVDTKVGLNIRTLRTTMGVSLGLLAREAGVSEAALSDYERGVARPRAEDLLAIATCLKVEISDLFAGV